MSLPEWAKELSLEVEAAKTQEQAWELTKEIDAGKLKLSHRETPPEVRQQLSPFCWCYLVGKPSQWISGEDWEGYADLYLAEACTEQATAAWCSYLTQEQKG